MHVHLLVIFDRHVLTWCRFVRHRARASETLYSQLLEEVLEHLDPISDVSSGLGQGNGPGPNHLDSNRR